MQLNPRRSQHTSQPTLTWRQQLGSQGLSEKYLNKGIRLEVIFFPDSTRNHLFQGGYVLLCFLKTYRTPKGTDPQPAPKKQPPQDPTCGVLYYRAPSSPSAYPSVDAPWPHTPLWGPLPSSCSDSLSFHSIFPQGFHFTLPYLFYLRC